MATSDFSVRVRAWTRVVGSMSQPTAASAAAARRVGARASRSGRTAAAREALRQRHVLGHRHPFDEAEILVDEGDGLARAGAPARWR